MRFLLRYALETDELKLAVKAFQNVDVLSCGKISIVLPHVKDRVPCAVCRVVAVSLAFLENQDTIGFSTATHVLT